MARLILFYRDETANISVTESLAKIDEQNTQMFELVIKKTVPTITFKDLVKALTKMAVFCSYGLAMNEPENSFESVIGQLIDIGYTSDEEAWIQSRVRQVEDTLKSVAVSDRIIKGFAMLSFGVPLTKQVLVEAVALGKERCWRAFLTQPEFHSLSAPVKFLTKEKKVTSVLALALARLESLETGRDQFEFTFGDEDKNSWNETYGPVLGGGQLAKVHFFQSFTALLQIPISSPVNPVESFFCEAKRISCDKGPML